MRLIRKYFETRRMRYEKVLIILLAALMISVTAAPAMAGGPSETARALIQSAVDKGLGPQAVPESGLLYCIDLMSNSLNWKSYLVVINWDPNVRIHLWTYFLPAGGTPNDVQIKDFYINAQDIEYFDPNDLGFNDFGPTNWYGIVWNDTDAFFTCGVLLYHTEFGLTWIQPWGPY